MPASSIWNLRDFNIDELQTTATNFSFGIENFSFPPSSQIRLTGRFFCSIRELYNYVDQVENDDYTTFEDIFTFIQWLEMRPNLDNANLEPPRLVRTRSNRPSFFSEVVNTPFTPPDRVSYMTASNFLRIQELLPCSDDDAYSSCSTDDLCFELELDDHSDPGDDNFFTDRK